MTSPVIAFFNNKGGMGKTSLAYHLAWMFVDLGKRVVAADLDPQANLTAAFLEEERLEELWSSQPYPRTVFGSVQPILRGIGDITAPYLEVIDDSEDRLALLVGDLALSSFEDELSTQWPNCLDRQERAFRVISAFWRVMQQAAQQHMAEIVLVDLGPNLGAINRAALIAADDVVVPLSPDLFSLQGLRNLGPALCRWREEWQERRSKAPVQMQADLPSGKMQPAGYVVLQHAVRLDRPMRTYNRWIARIPQVYRQAVLGELSDTDIASSNDLHCLALLKNYRSLMPMAQETRKPIHHLKPADGALGSHLQAARSAAQDFRALAGKIAERAGIVL